MSHEYYNIVIGGEGGSNGINAEKITFFSNFVRVSKGLLSTIVGVSPYAQKIQQAATLLCDKNTSGKARSLMFC